MNLQPMVMDRTVARKAFLEYRRAVRASVDRELREHDQSKREALARRRALDEGIMAGYRLLAIGNRIISIREVIRSGGEDSAHRPKLAIARADRQSVTMRRGMDGDLSFGQNATSRGNRNPRTNARIDLPAGTMPTFTRPSGWSVWQTEFQASAMVPLIPPQFRPVQLERYHVLFEAEWQPVAPRDPALLRALGGGLYAIVAVWDLTDLERAVLELRT